MAEEPVTKWWAVGAKEEVTARKYISFLHKHSMFGGHVGLPENIRNEDPNRSLDSSRGIYDMVEVYSLSGTSCPTGTVVNFLLDNPVNPLGKTYVYPCNDTSKPMGYMITKAEPNIWGVCVVSGILEVPLIYLRDTSSSELERKDYVEYDLENKAFKFSDSGYPVFNVYQDVDGDWIAIILFGNTKSDYEYDGPFAVSVSGVTGSTTFVDVLGGDVFFNDVRDVCDDLTVPIGISTGESLWLSTMIVGNTHSYDFLSLHTTPIDGSTVFYTKIAENNDGDIRQIHYGDIRYSRTKIIAGSNKITVSPSNGLGDVTIDVNESVIGGGTFYTPNYTQLAISGDTVPEGYLGQTFVLPVRAGTVGFFDDGGGAAGVWTDVNGTNTHPLTNKNLYSAPSDGWIRVSVIDGGTASGACLSIQDITGNIPVYKYGDFGEDNIEYKQGTGIAITGETDSSTGLLTGNKIVSLSTTLSSSVSDDTATISITGITNSLVLKAGTDIDISGSGNTVTIAYSGSGGGGGSFNYPNYQELGTIPSTVPESHGVTFLLPVQSGHSIGYYTDSGSPVIAKYAPAVGSESGSSFYLSNGTSQSAGADGWVRISVFDDGSTPNKCLRFRDNGHEFPLYKYGVIGGGTSGGGGYDGGYSGGGGSVNAPNWGWNGASGGETARIEYDSANYVTKVLLAPNFTDSGLTSYTTPSSGWLYAFANVSNGFAHLRINGAEFKVAYSGGSNWVGSGICIPVNSGATVEWSVSASSSAVGCVFYAT